MLLIGLAIFLIRGIALYFSINLAAKISKENLSIQKNAWMGFLPIGGLMLGLSIVIGRNFPGLGSQLKGFNYYSCRFEFICRTDSS